MSQILDHVLKLKWNSSNFTHLGKSSWTISSSPGGSIHVGSYNITTCCYGKIFTQLQACANCNINQIDLTWLATLQQQQQASLSPSKKYLSLSDVIVLVNDWLKTSPLRTFPVLLHTSTLRPSHLEYWQICPTRSWWAPKSSWLKLCCVCQALFRPTIALHQKHNADQVVTGQKQLTISCTAGLNLSTSMTYSDREIATSAVQVRVAVQKQ